MGVKVTVAMEDGLVLTGRVGKAYNLVIKDGNM